MSVQLQMLGRQLPCNLLDLLQVRPMPLPSPTHNELQERITAGQDYPDLHYKLALSHLGRQELGLARRHLQFAVKKQPQYVPARLALAIAHDLLAEHAQAIDQLDAVLGMTQTQVSRGALACAAGLCLERMAACGAAAFRYQQALSEDAGYEMFAHQRLAAIYLAHNELDKAVEHHEAILEIDPQDQAVRTSLAHALQLLGRHKEAVWEYQKALCLEPDSWELQLELADQLQRMGDSDQAIAHLNRLVEEHPEFPDLRLRLGNLHSVRGEDKAAVAQYEQALSVHPNYLDCHIALARHELRMGRAAAAVAHFQRAMTVNDQNVEAYAGLSVALHRLGRSQESSEMLASARKIAGNSDVLLGQMGQLELEAQAAQEADELFDPARQSSRSNVQQEVQQHWIEQQVHRYQQMLEQHPSWTDVRVRCGMLLKLLGRSDEAIAQFQRVTHENPGYTQAWVQLGLTYQQTGHITQAVEALETAIQIRPQWADLHYRLALIYCGEMEFDLALERLEDAAALNRNNADFQRQIWAALEGMQMRGYRAASAVQAQINSSPSEPA